MRTFRLHHVLLLLGLFFGAVFVVQAQRGRVPYPPGAGRPDESEPNDPRKKLQKRMVRESFLAMQKESEELVDLSTKLRDQLSKSSEDELSLDAMRKAEEIEKLAEKIKNRIKNL